MELFVSFSEIMHFFKRNKFKFLLVVLVFGVLCGLAPLKLLTIPYSVNSSITLSCEIPENASTDYRLQYTNILGSRVQTAIAQAASNNLLEKTAQKLGIKDTEISKITGEQMNSAPVIKLTVQTTDAEKAAEISDTAAQILADQMMQEFPSPKLSVVITDKAQPAKAQSKKSAMAKAGLLGLVLGFIAYACFGVICVLSDRSVRNARVAEEALKTKLLAEIPHETRGRNKEDAYRKLRAATLHQYGSVKNFMVSSVNDNDGGEEAAAGLALSLAQAGKKVLVVDADLRAPKLAQLLNVKASKMLNDVLIGSCSLQEAAADVPGKQNLSLLAGAQIDEESPADLFAKGFEKFVANAEALYDFVVVYAPSEISYPDADSLAVFTQAVILTAKYGSTTYESLKEALRGMQSAGGKVIGFVITDA
ncbi:MAG TPA: hypothetical protein VHP31_11660 [Caproicibacter sp.]|nr:hypothetical protein [Caproicibacter sp.]